MDDIKLRLTQAVAGRLSAAPRSQTKDELIEELSDNLYRRFLEMTGAGVDEEAAFNRALDDLGDVDELLSYLSEEPEAAGAQSQGAPGGSYHFDAGASQSDLDAIFSNVSEICRMAVGQAKDAVNQAADAVRRRTTVKRDKGHVQVHFNSSPEEPVPQEPPAAAAPPEAPAAPEPPKAPEPPAAPQASEPVPPPEAPEQPPKGWEFEAELDTDEGRFFAGGGPKERKDIIYGFGYDKARGGFFAQWGEYQGGGESADGPHFCGEDGSYMEHQDDGTYSVTALRDLRGIEVFTEAGDVSIHMSEAPDAGVIIDGDVDDLEVACSADGVLTIREGRTASSSFFSRMGFRSADVELFLPRRHWETITATTASGDVDIDRDGLDIDCLTVTTASGDLNCRLRACAVLSFKSASGDLELQGTCTDLIAETKSGDLSLKGQVENAQLKTASGDISLEGLVSGFHAKTMSGDVEVETSALPQAMELSSKSGECEARIPDAGPFSVRLKTISGELECEFPVNYNNGLCVYGDGSGPMYTMSSISGDVSLKRY